MRGARHVARIGTIICVQNFDRKQEDAGADRTVALKYIFYKQRT
jgi:hypothetical protein